jgi:hypothetical protein
VILGKTDQSLRSRSVHALTAPHVIDPARFLSEQLEQASPDLVTVRSAESRDAGTARHRVGLIAVVRSGPGQSNLLGFRLSGTVAAPHTSPPWRTPNAVHQSQMGRRDGDAGKHAKKSMIAVGSSVVNFPPLSMSALFAVHRKRGPACSEIPLGGSRRWWQLPWCWFWSIIEIILWVVLIVSTVVFVMSVLRCTKVITVPDPTGGSGGPTGPTGPIGTGGTGGTGGTLSTSARRAGVRN